MRLGLWICRTFFLREPQPQTLARACGGSCSAVWKSGHHRSQQNHSSFAPHHQAHLPASVPDWVIDIQPFRGLGDLNDALYVSVLGVLADVLSVPASGSQLAFCISCVSGVGLCPVCFCVGGPGKTTGLRLSKTKEWGRLHFRQVSVTVFSSFLTWPVYHVRPLPVRMGHSSTIMETSAIISGNTVVPEGTHPSAPHIRSMTGTPCWILCTRRILKDFTCFFV